MRSRTVQVLKLLPLIFLATCAKRGADGPHVGSDLSCKKTTTVHVLVKGVRSHDGNMMLALFSSSDGFPGDPLKAKRRVVVPIEEDEVSFTLTELAVGRYAVSILHDENGDREMETDFLGRPKEGYGFSRNARGRFGPPSFDSAAFEATADPLTIHVDLEY